MADRIKGITLEINGNTIGLQDALKDVNKNLKDTQTQLKDVNKLLKLDPKNVDLLRQKQKLLTDAIGDSKKKLDTLKEAQSQYAQGSKEWDAIEKEIVDCKNELQTLEKQYKDFGSVATQQMHAVGKSMQEAGKKIQNVGQKLQPLSTAATAVGAGLVGLAYKSVTASDDLNTLAKQTGFTTAEIQKMQYAADRIDVSFSDIEGALKKLKPQITEDSAKLKELGVSTINTDGSLRSATEVFYDVITALSGIENETERDQKAMEIFGKGADALSGIIDDGGAALREYGQEAEDLGLILSQDTLDSLNSINDAVDKAKAEGGAALASLGATVAQALLPVIEKLPPIIDKISSYIAGLSPKTVEMILKITAVVAAVAPLLSVIGSITTGIGGLLMVLTPTTAIIAVVVAAIVAATILIIKNWDKIKDAASKLWAKIKEIFEKIKTTIVGIFTAIQNTVSSIIAGIVNNVLGKFNSITNGIRTALNTALSIVQTIVNKISSIFGGARFEFPKIKLPHFKVSSGKTVMGITLPKISVEWYRKAYETPYLFTQPTIVNGRGFGDGNGGEIVYGRDQLMRDIASVTGETVINVYATPGMNVNQLADKVAQRMAQVQKQRASVYA